MDLKSVFAALSGVLVVVALVPYILSVVRREATPSKASWIIWTILAFMTAGGMYQANALNLQIVLVVLGDVIILSLALLYGTSSWKPRGRVARVRGPWYRPVDHHTGSNLRYCD